MATARIEGLNPDYSDVSGKLEINRRLSDKVLAAFNHAYATGEIEVAEKLRSILKMTETKRAAAEDRRIGYDALVHADLWVGFVKARNRYNDLCNRKPPKKADIDAAMAAMKDAYRAWSDV